MGSGTFSLSQSPWKEYLTPFLSSDTVSLVFLDPAFHAKFRQEGHHLPHGKACHLSSFAERSVALLVFFHRQQDPALRHQVAHGFGEITALLLGDLGKEIVACEKPTVRSTLTDGYPLACALRSLLEGRS